eukprot:GFYU01011625.1.p1 GENE.GFYU01011625.1~~GFYU01011625.1.p1  ORF type:complete len:223 (-),score=68.09 GFYU01011625.1:416-1084(-)
MAHSNLTVLLLQALAVVCVICVVAAAAEESAQPDDSAIIDSNGEVPPVEVEDPNRRDRVRRKKHEFEEKKREEQLNLASTVRCQVCEIVVDEVVKKLKDIGRKVTSIDIVEAVDHICGPENTYNPPWGVHWKLVEDGPKNKLVPQDPTQGLSIDEHSSTAMKESCKYVGSWESELIDMLEEAVGEGNLKKVKVVNKIKRNWCDNITNVCPKPKKAKKKKKSK